MLSIRKPRKSKDVEAGDERFFSGGHAPFKQSDDGPRSYLFLAPRYHTNMVGWVGAMLCAGKSVGVAVVNVGLTEDHSLLTPVVLEPTLLAAKRIRKALDANIGEAPEDLRLRYFKLKPGALARMVRESKTDVLFLRRETRMVGRVFVAMLLSGQKLTCVEYDQLPLDTPPGLRASLRLFFLRIIFWGRYRRVSSVLSRSPLTAIEFRNLIDTHEASFMPFSMGLREGSGRQKSTEPICILAVGKMRPYKSWDLMLDALLSLAPEVREKFRVRLVGQAKLQLELDYLRSLVFRIEKAGLNHVIEIQPNVTPVDMAGHYEWATCTLLVSRNESAAISPLEGMAFGAFPISTSQNGTNCYFENNTSGLVFDAGDPQSLANLLEELTLAPHRIHSLRSASSRVLETRAGPHFFLGQVEKISGQPSGC